MKGWIKLNILSYTKQSEELEDLGVPNSEEYHEFKESLIQVSLIAGISLDVDTSQINGNCIVYIAGLGAIHTLETPEEIIDLINNA